MQKLVAAGTTFAIDVIVAIVVGVFLLVAMNGYSESAATWGMAVYLIAAVGASCLAAFMAVSMLRTYLRKAKSPAAGVFLSISICTSIGIFVIVVSGFIAVAVAEYARTHR